jgi:hypothetical protein
VYQAETDLGHDDQTPVTPDLEVADSVLTETDIPVETKEKEIFLEEKEPARDVIHETFTPVEDAAPKHERYHISWFWIILCALIVCALACLGFYYTDFLSSDYLLGMNQAESSQRVAEKQITALARRNRLRQSPPVQTAIKTWDNIQRRPVEEPTATPKQVVENSVTVEPSLNETVSAPFMDNEEATIEDITPPVTSFDPVVIYRDHEIIKEPDGRITVKMRGTVQNPSRHEIVLPPAVHAVAFDGNGQEVFRKEVYLTTRFLAPGEAQDVFGSYTWMPTNPDVMIQWIEMSF